MTKTLKAMLVENTGQHFLDSGVAYGRSWQQNQGRDFAAEPAATITVEEGYIDIRRSTYHFLNECLEFDEAMNERFYEFASNKGRSPWLMLMEEFTDELKALNLYGEGPPVAGIYGEGNPVTVNTYNHDSLLDQVIQYVYFELDERGYVLLQIHGGCDVRGGYTAPKAFRCNIDNSPSIFDDGSAAVGCKDDKHRWFVQEGSWDVGHYEKHYKRTLDEFPIISGEIEVHEKDAIAKGVIIWQDAEGVHCPLCGEILEVW